MLQARKDNFKRTKSFGCSFPKQKVIINRYIHNYCVLKKVYNNPSVKCKFYISTQDSLLVEFAQSGEFTCIKKVQSYVVSVIIWKFLRYLK